MSLLDTRKPKLLVEAQIVENKTTGKFRVGITIIKDDLLQIDLFATADEAENIAKTLLELSQQARGKNIVIPS